MRTYIGARFVRARPCILAEAMNLGVIKRAGDMDIRDIGYLVELSSGVRRWIPEKAFRREFLPADLPETDDDPVDVSEIAPCLGRWSGDFDIAACVEFMMNWAVCGVGNKNREI